MTGRGSFIDQSFSVIVVSLMSPTLCAVYTMLYIHIPTSLTSETCILVQQFGELRIQTTRLCPTAPYSLVQSAEVGLACETMYVHTIPATKMATHMWQPLG